LAVAFYYILLSATSSHAQEDPVFSYGNKATATSKEDRSKNDLEEAKVLARSFQKTGYILPPRSISDLKELLAPANNPERHEKLQALKKQAYAEQPENLSGRPLLLFLNGRAGSLSDIGQAEDSLREYRNLVKLIENKSLKPSFREIAFVYAEAAFAEIRSGSFRKGIELATISANAKMDKDICKGAVLATFYASYGALTKAEKWIKRSYSNLKHAKFEYWKKWQELDVRACYYRGVSYIEYAKGQYQSAVSFIEKSLLYSLKAYRLDPKHYTAIGPVKNASVRGLLHGMMLKTKFLLHTKKNIEAELNERQRLKIILENWGVNSERTVGSLHSMAHILISQNRIDEAKDLIIKAQDIWKIIGTGVTSSRRIETSLLFAEIHTLRKEWDKALLIYNTSIQNSHGDIDFITSDPNYILTLIKNNKMKKAYSILETLRDEMISRLGKKNQKVAELNVLLAMVSQALGKSGSAIDYFANNIPIILSRSRQSVDDSESSRARDFRVSLYLESYIETLLDTKSIQHITTAFLLADTARGSSVRTALHKYGDRISSGNKENISLIRQEQDIQKQISALYGLLTYHASLSEGERDGIILSKLRGDIDKLRDLRSILISNIEESNPRYMKAKNTINLTIEDLQTYLSKDEVIISFYVGSNYSVVWALNNSSDLHFHKIDIKEEDLKFNIEKIRYSLNPDAAALSDIPEFPINLTYNVYRKFLHPLEIIWKDKKHLQLITHKSLSHLPLSLLTTKPHNLTNETLPYFAKYRDVPWLVKSHSITVLPSLDSIPILRKKKKLNTKRLPFIGFADPMFERPDTDSKQYSELILQAESDKSIKKRGATARNHKIVVRSKAETGDLMSATLKDLPQLPDTREEVHNMAVAMGADLSKDVFFGSDATETRVKNSNLEIYRIVAFATHGLVAGDLDGLNQPAIALSSPEISEEEEDGLLTMGEIMGLRLEADWVVLSACNTGSGKDIEAEAISGLGRAFLYSGAKALLVSNWPVETTSARILTTDIFARHVASPSLRKSEALRQAMLGLIHHPGYKIPNTEQIIFKYAHPLFWAPFSLVGHGGVISGTKN